MVFRRRDRRSWARIVLEFFYPRGGWYRAAQYVRHRLRRLPDSPNRIARGIWAGVFVSFTPFYGLHFLTAFLVAKVMRGNILAAILGTFFGNPITFPIIAALSLRLGHGMLGTRPVFGRGPNPDDSHGLMKAFSGAMSDLWHNFLSIFTPDHAHWGKLAGFFDDVFLPYLVGGLIPGVIAATICYYVSVPILTAYQQRRKGQLKAKLQEIAAKRKKQESEVAGE
ncbi:DUF2062 domain-containing protein [Vannielia litorea]|nr:DUF2062 domain-containing protein [Vannielia litorea]